MGDKRSENIIQGSEQREQNQACLSFAESRRRLVKISFGKDIFTMKSLILAQDER